MPLVDNISWVGNASCPNITTDSSNGTCIFNYHASLVSVGLTSSILSILGAFFIILTYILFKELRTKARFVLLMIAISDLVNSIAYIFAFVYTAKNVYYSLCYENKPTAELQLCAIQSATNMFATLTSNCWTCVLGIHITCLFFSRNYLDNKWVMGLAHTICWICSFILVAFSYGFGRLGPGAQSVNVGWCFVSNYTIRHESVDSLDHALIEFFISKFWESVTVFILAIVYTVSACKLCHFNYKNRQCWAFTERHDYRLIWIPVVYLLLRLWGNIRWFLEITRHSTFNSCPKLDIVFAFLQVVGDTGQGWANGILYIIFNQAMRKRIFECFSPSRGKKVNDEKNKLVFGSGLSNNERSYVN